MRTPICLADKEIVDHLLVNGKVAQALEVIDQLVQLQMGISQNPYWHLKGIEVGDWVSKKESSCRCPLF